MITRSKVSIESTENEDTMAKTRILVVEDDGASAKLAEMWLKSLGYAVPAVISSGKEAIKKAGEVHPDLVLMDIRLKGDMDGVQAAGEIHARFNIPVVYLTAYADNEILQRAKINEPYGYILKPFEKIELRTAIELALYKHKMDSKLLEREQAFEKRTAELKTNNEQLQREITERKQMEDRLRESEEKSRVFMETASDLMNIADKDGKFTYVNDSMARTLEYSKEELLAMHITQLLSKESLEKDFKPNWGKFLTNGEISLETTFLTKEGKEIHCELKAVAVYDSDGNLVGSRAVNRDITERKRVEYELQERMKELGCLYEIASITERPGITLDEIYKETVELIPQSLQYPEVACAQLTIDGKAYKTSNYRETEWKESADIKVHGIKAGMVEVVYLEDRPASDEGLFLKQERLLIDAVAGRLGRITERKRTEQALKASEDKYRQLINTSNDAVITVDSEMKISVWNHAAVKMFGYTEKAILGKSLMKIVPERFRKAMESGFAVFAKNGSGPILGKVVEVHGLRKDGTEIPIELSVSAIKAGETYLATGIIRDITERKRLEKRWWDSMTNFIKVVDNIADGIIVTNREGIMRFVNPAAELLFGRKSADFKGKQFGFPITSGDTTEIDIIRKAGETVAAEMSMVETVWYDNFAYLISLHDITERKRAEQVQERLSQQLQAKISELETFSYGIAHDLRSPLVSIEGFSRELREDMQNQKVENMQEDIRLLESGVRKMHGFLDRTLEYSRAGQLIKRNKNVSFSKIVKEVITEFNGQISSIGATVSLADRFPRVYADRTRIIQVLTNLIQNSIKYRDKTVPLKIEIGHYSSANEVVFFVRDNGLGMDASEVEKLFDLFYRGTADGEGSGIGLPIVKKIIEAHGGMIWAQQGQSGKGTAMCFTLPKQSGTNKGDNNGKD